MAFKIPTLAASVACIVTGSAAAAADVDLMFVIDNSGSMRDEYLTLADNIADVLSGIAADSRIDSVGAGLVSYTGNPELIQGITTDAADLKSDLESEADGVGGATERGLRAMASVLPGGSLFGSAGWRDGSVRSLVLITDEDNDTGTDFGADDYGAFESILDSSGYLNNVIVSDRTRQCSSFGGTSSVGGCEYIATSRPAGGAATFDLIEFTGDPAAFFTQFVDTKVREIIDVIEPKPGVVPLPAAGWMLLAGLGAIGLTSRRRKS